MIQSNPHAVIPGVYEPPPEFEEVRARRYAEMSPEQAKRHIEDALRRADLPPKLQRVRFEDLITSQDPEAHRICQKFAESGEYDGKLGLLLLGRSGCGKTTLAAATLKRIIERTGGAQSACFWNIPRGLELIRARINEENTKGESILDIGRNFLAVLDDFGKGKFSEWVAEQFYILFDELDSQERRVIITSNLQEKNFKRFDEALTSRIVGMCHIVRMTGDDYRLRSCS
jgi:DNA replication protein DnaC